MAEYRVKTIALDNGLDRTPIVEANVRIYNVSVLSLPPGASLSLHIGNHDAIPVVAGDTMDDPRGCPIEEHDGLYGTAPAQPGVTAVLYIGFGSGGVSR